MKRITFALKPTIRAMHVFTKGHRGNNIFYEAADYIVYLALLKQYVRLQQHLDKDEPFSQAVQIHAYGLQPSTVQLLIRDSTSGLETTKLMRAIHISYTRYHQKKYGSNTPLFTDVYKSTFVEDNRGEYTLVAAMHAVTGNKWYQDSRLFYELGKEAGWIQPLKPQYQAK